MKPKYTNHRSATKFVRDTAIFAAEAYRASHGWKRTGWRELTWQQQAIELLESAIRDIKRSQQEHEVGTPRWSFQ